MGGIALGKGVTQSGLLEVLDGVIRDLLQDVSPYNVVLILSPVVLVRRVSLTYTLYMRMNAQRMNAGDLDLHQPHHRERTPGTDREGGGLQPARAREPCESPHFRYRADLLGRDGHARVGVP